MATPSACTPFVSIIVPTYNRPIQLQCCLEGLAALAYPRERYEVLVVIDGGSEVPGALIRSAGSRTQIRLVGISHGGPAAARNAGAGEARWEFLAFTDDDCLPAPDWLAALTGEAARHPDFMFGGRTVNALEENAYSTASQLLIDYLYHYYRGTRPGRFFTTNNMALRTRPFLDLGGFDTAFSGAAGEDREFCDRWVRSGRAMRYVPEAVVYHAHPLTFTSFCRLHARYGRAGKQFHELRAFRRGEKVVLEPPSFYAGLVGYPFRLAGSRRRAVLTGLLVVSQVSNAIGYCREALGRRPSGCSL